MRKKAPLAGAITVLGMAFLSPAAFGAVPPGFYQQEGGLTTNAPMPQSGTGTMGGTDGPRPAMSPMQPNSNPPVQQPGPQGKAPSLGSMLKATTKCRRAARGFRVCRTTLNGHLLRSCRTRGKGRHRVQICRMFDEMGRHASTCKKVGKKKPNCHRVKTTRARATTLIDQGWNGTTIPQLVRIYNGGKGWCTGTLVSRGIVLTAGHCIAAAGQGYYNKASLVVVPANGWTNGQGTAPYGNFYVSRTVTPTGYLNGTDKTLDWGLIETSPNANGYYAGDYVGTYPAQWGARITQGNTLVRTGYPGELPFEEAQYGGGNIQYHCNHLWSGEQWNLQGSQFGMKDSPCIMNGGSSGGPVFWYNGSKWVVVAVNNWAERQTPCCAAVWVSAVWFSGDFGTFWTGAMRNWYG